MAGHPSKAEILAALSHALDLVEGQPEGHALRTSVIATRLAEQLGLDTETRHGVFFASVLKDSGCSNNAVRVHKIFGGDELATKRAVKTIDWTSTVENVRFTLHHTERGQGISAKLKRMAANIGPPIAIMNQVTEARCTRGAMIARMLGFDESVAEAVHQLDEHWDGKGSPYGAKGDEIGILGRIVCLAQTAEVFAATYGVGASVDVVSKRAGTWFDPEVAKCFGSLAREESLWNAVAEATFVNVVPNGLRDEVAEADLDAICQAFAMIVDAKSSFTAQHSARVAEFARQIAGCMGLGAEQERTLWRAGLLHDIGKLGVSTGILDKPGKLDEDEFSRVKNHPRLGFEILGRIGGFDTFAKVASGHHERLDGRGYWRGLAGEEISLETRIMTVADVYDALSAARPYRGALPHEECRAIMERDRGTAFDHDCLDALWATTGQLASAA